MLSIFSVKVIVKFDVCVQLPCVTVKSFGLMQKDAHCAALKLLEKACHSSNWLTRRYMWLLQRLCYYVVIVLAMMISVELIVWIMSFDRSTHLDVMMKVLWGA